MRDWRRARQAGEPSLDRRVHRRTPSSNGEALEKRTQFMEECGGDLSCVRGKMQDWRRAGKPSLDRRARRARKARKDGEASLDRVRHRRPSSNGEALKKRSQFADECGGDLACVRDKMREWRRAGKPSLDRRARRARRARKAGEASLDRRVHRRGPSSSDASEKRTQFMEECGGDAACVRGKMRDWRKARKAGEASF